MGNIIHVVLGHMTAADVFPGFHGRGAHYVAKLTLELDVSLDVNRDHGVVYGYLGEASVAEVEGGDPVSCTRAALNSASVGDSLRLGVLRRLPVLQSVHGGSPSLPPLRPTCLHDPPHVLPCLLRC